MKLVAIILVLLSLTAVGALLAKRHFSTNIDGSWVVPRIAGRLQKLEVLHGRSLEDATKRYIEQRFRRFMTGLLLLWILGLGVLLLPDGEKETGMIRRPEAGEDASGVTVQLTDAHGTTEAWLSIGSRSLTEEEFSVLSEDTFQLLEKDILGRNESADHVTGDLSFPDRDSTGKLEISWDTDELTVISRNGTVKREELKQECTVNVTATLTDGIRTKEKVYQVRVVPFSATETEAERALRSLKEMEESSRDEEVFRLPAQVEGVTVREQKKTGKEMICKLYPGLVLAGVFLFFLRGSKEKERIKKRDERLSSVFYRFVKRMALLIGAGESLNASLMKAATVETDYLLPEVQLAVNRIRTGSSEPEVYADLGRGLGLPSYVRLFSTISTAAPRGSSQLLKLMEQEVKSSEAEAKESARRRGEQASEKLMLPMIILMIVVIGILLYPAVAGM